MAEVFHYATPAKFGYFHLTRCTHRMFITDIIFTACNIYKDIYSAKTFPTWPKGNNAGSYIDRGIGMALRIMMGPATICVKWGINTCRSGHDATNTSRSQKNLWKDSSSLIIVICGLHMTLRICALMLRKWFSEWTFPLLRPLWCLFVEINWPNLVTTKSFLKVSFSRDFIDVKIHLPFRKDMNTFF